MGDRRARLKIEDHDREDGAGEKSCANRSYEPAADDRESNAEQLHNNENAVILIQMRKTRDAAERSELGWRITTTADRIQHSAIKRPPNSPENSSWKPGPLEPINHPQDFPHRRREKGAQVKLWDQTSKILYKARARIEQVMGRVKRFKRVALRCEKAARNFRSIVAFAAGLSLIKFVRTA